MRSFLYLIKEFTDNKTNSNKLDYVALPTLSQVINKLSYAVKWWHILKTQLPI